jgi:hypothetical protein
MVQVVGLKRLVADGEPDPPPASGTTVIRSTSRLASRGAMLYENDSAWSVGTPALSA